MNGELNKIEEDEKSALWKSDFSGMNRKKSFRAASNIMFALGAIDLLHALYLHLRKPEVQDYIEFEPY
ncbi:MAG: hypothetical protein JSV84_06610 [Gemmatimonadota bacterium]|nr:MAG: hypothetical protein JSV84_06610 [Gemmatimonadota bacterium]